MSTRESARLRAHRMLPCALFACVLLGCGDDSDGDEPCPPDAGDDAAADAALGAVTEDELATIQRCISEGALDN